MTTQANLDWTAADKRTVDLIRVLAMDAVQKVGNGHPGTAMSLAPAAYLLFQRLMRHDPADPNWPGRDRFVLSCGHSSLTLYIQLYLSGYGLTMDDLKALRTWGSITPGHPEHRLTPGVEFAALGGREVCERLAARGVLAKDTHGTTIRLAPPLVIAEEDLDWALDRLEEAVR